MASSRSAPGGPGEEALVPRHVLEADDATVGLELGDAVDQEERVAVGQDALDGRAVERQGEVIGWLARLYS